MKIVLTADGSAYTTKAAHYLSTHIGVFGAGAELHVVTVTPPLPQGLAASNARRLLGEEAVNRYYAEEADAALRPAEKVLSDAAIPFRSHRLVGTVAEEIAGFAEKNQVDLIVMGSHGHGALANAIMGSVATKVLAATTVPVLLIR
jgi:nucleotide-binding universal stress UspA family protein